MFEKIFNLKTQKCDKNFEKILYSGKKILRKGCIENKKILAP